MVILFLLVCAFSSAAQKGNAYQEQLLRNVFHSFNNASLYCYKSTVQYQYVDAPQKRLNTVKSLNYQSKQPFCFYSQSDEGELYIASNTYIKVDHPNSMIWHYAIVEEQDSIPEVFQSASYLNQVDSLLKQSRIKKVEKKGLYTVFYVEPDKSHPMRNLVVTCNTKEQVLQSLSFDMTYTVPNTDGISILCKVDIEHMAYEMPTRLVQIQSANTLADEVFKHHYPKYTFQQIQL